MRLMSHRRTASVRRARPDPEAGNCVWVTPPPRNPQSRPSHHHLYFHPAKAWRHLTRRMETTATPDGALTHPAAMAHVAGSHP